MGTGIAIQFQKHYLDLQKYLLEEIKANKIGCPSVVEYEGHSVFNLITKVMFNWKPTYGTMNICLKKLAEICRERDIKFLVMPKIGCGYDRLMWNRVLKLIELNFNELEIEILIKYLED